MKTNCFIFSLLVIPFIVNAQDAVVSATNMNILYLGVSNPVEIAVPGVTSDKIMATITNGTINRTATGWEVKPLTLAESTITVLVNNSKVTEKKFRVKSIPPPVAVFAGLNNGAISKNVAVKTELLEAKVIDFDWDLKFEIVSFNLYIQNKTVDTTEFSKGNKLTDKMRSVIADLEAGQSIIFKDIKAIGPDGRIHDLNPVILKLD